MSGLDEAMAWLRSSSHGDFIEDELNRLADTPEFDGTDAAHPAWWRAHDYTTDVICSLINKILDGKDDGRGANCEPWGSVRKRLISIVNKESVK